MPPSPAATIIDVGCGTGANLAGLAGEYDCIGIDASYEPIQLARQRFPHIRFIHGLAPRDLGSAIKRARLVLLSDVLEHVSDDFGLFRNCWPRRPRGLISCSTVPADPNLWSEHDRSFGHYRRYDVARLEQVWQDWRSSRSLSRPSTPGSIRW